jgi:hypothetical protein
MANDPLEKRALEIATEVIFLRTASNKAAVIVEGSSDIKLFERLLDLEKCEVISADGRDNALIVAKELQDHGFEGFLTIIDNDQDHALGRDVSNENVFYCDENDVETMLFRSDALNSILVEWGSPSKIDAKDGISNIRDNIAACAKVLGAIRFYAREKGLALKFEGISFGFVCRQTLDIDLSDVVGKIYNHSRMAKSSYGDEVAAISVIVSQANDHWSLVSGHDLCTILGKALQGYCGSAGALDCRPEIIERLLRLSYTKEYFVQTSLYGRIRAWEWANSSYGFLEAA